jgi:hypothetical protein
MSYQEKGNDEIPIIPITIQDLSIVQEVKSGIYSLRDVKIEFLELVCRIRDISETSLRFTLTLQDSFGSFPAFIYKNRPETYDGFESQENMYYRVVGKYNARLKKPTFIIERLVPITRADDVVCHRMYILWYRNYTTGNLKRCVELEKNVKQ